VAPKVDVELVYTELKKAVGEGWVVYKEAVAGFVLGECCSRSIMTRSVAMVMRRRLMSYSEWQEAEGEEVVSRDYSANAHIQVF